MTVYELKDKIDNLAANGWGSCNVKVSVGEYYIDIDHRREWNGYASELDSVAVDSDTRIPAIILYGKDLDGGEK